MATPILVQQQAPSIHIPRYSAQICGWRRVGYLYLTEYPGYDGAPLEGMTFCPIPYIDLKAEGLGPLGMFIKERYVPGMGTHSGVYDVWDVLSLTENKYLADFWEQTQRFGISRLFPKNLLEHEHFKDLRVHPTDPMLSSRHIIVAQNALLADPAPIYEHRTNRKHCPAGIGEHDRGERSWESCTALHWEIQGECPKGQERQYTAYIPRDYVKQGYDRPSFSYQADHLPEGVSEPETMAGILLSLVMPREAFETPRDLSGADQDLEVQRLIDEAQGNYTLTIMDA